MTSNVKYNNVRPVSPDVNWNLKKIKVKQDNCND